MTTAIEFKPVSLLDRIRQANSNDELLSLEKEGFGYQYASINTRGKWKKASLTRKAQILKGNKRIETNPRDKTDKKISKDGNK